jgi:hypothetical protein
MASGLGNDMSLGRKPGWPPKEEYGGLSFLPAIPELRNGEDRPSCSL